MFIVRVPIYINLYLEFTENTQLEYCQALVSTVDIQNPSTGISAIQSSFGRTKS